MGNAWKTENGSGERAGRRDASSFPFQFHVLVLRRANSSGFLSASTAVSKWFGQRRDALGRVDKDLVTGIMYGIVSFMNSPRHEMAYTLVTPTIPCHDLYFVPRDALLFIAQKDFHVFFFSLNIKYMYILDFSI